VRQHEEVVGPLCLSLAQIRTIIEFFVYTFGSQPEHEWQ